jgi:hypothetical protein
MNFFSFISILNLFLIRISNEQSQVGRPAPVKDAVMANQFEVHFNLILLIPINLFHL